MRKELVGLISILFILMVVSSGTQCASGVPTNLYWGASVGEEISYRYHGFNTHNHLWNDTWFNETSSINEEVYVEIIDLYGIANPYRVESTPGIKSFWENGTQIIEDSNHFFHSMFFALGPYAVNLGNWTFIEEITSEAIESSYDEIYNHQIGWFNETTTLWNYTLVKFHYYNSSTITPYATIIKQYSKSDGVLNYMKWEFIEDPYQVIILELTRIPSATNLPVLVFGIGIGLIVVVVVILWKRKS